MKKTIHPGILISVGLVTFLLGNHVIGGVVGSAVFLVGFIMFISGFAGVVKLAFFSSNSEQALSDKLDQIYSSHLTHDKKISLSLSAIEKANLDQNQFEIFVGNIEKVYNITVKQ